MDEEISYPTGFGMSDILSWGSFGMVCLDKSSNTVIKSAHSKETEPFINAEKLIYERFNARGGHPGILKYFGTYDESSIRLEFAPNGDLRTYLHNNGQSIAMNDRKQWIIQIAQSLEFIHRARVVHGDLQCNNIFLDQDFHAKVADFSGSSLDGTPILVHVATNHAHPTKAGFFEGDVFSFGCLMYEIITGLPPYANLGDKEIRMRYSNNDFPSVDSLGPIGQVIRGCWVGEYSDISAVMRELQSKCLDCKQ